MRRALVIAAVALVSTGTAAAHVTVAPPFVENGVETEVAFAAPNERPPRATVELDVTAPPGISIVSASAPRGWEASVDGSTVTWSGGRLGDRETASFPIRILARVRAGTATFDSVQTYSDGATVRWTAALAVLPATGAAAPSQHPWGAIVAGLVGVIALVGGLVVVRLLRRRPLQER